ncbi:hypothetical protein D9757_011747 [Collybiopsis confluens]|uniref:Uncharacterized protein n=1 Tax=Collybiopsis confluens TaxID=2823264 RepID=A0A8H5LJS5_9AGAR|nr:hypothetical protein D9757_011747 [Collybiopsis confluens]
MSTPKPKVIQEMTRNLLLDAAKTGSLSTLSPKRIREILEEQLGLEDRALRPQKDLIQDAINKAMAEIKGSGEEKEDLEEPEVETKKPVSKEKKRTAAKTATKESKKPESSISKKRKADAGQDDKPSSSKAKKPKVPTSAKNDKKSFSSAAIVPPSSDIEDEQRTKLTTDKLTSSEACYSGNLESASKEPPSKASSSPVSELTPVPSPAVQVEEQSESELSVLEDEPPKPKGKGKSKESTKSKGKKEKKPRKGSTTTLSKDEETIKKLKALINACGVRKVWAKLFKDIENSPSQQIAMLRKVLTDLGMSGRLSMEQAKVIKEKRELASELADVQSFEQSVNKRSRRSQSTASKEEAASASESEEKSDEDGPPAKRKRSARQSIMAFLQDQSDSE